MADSTETDFISRIADLLSIDRDEVLKKLEGFDVDTVMDVLDAVASDDSARVSELLSDTENEAKSSDEEDVEDLSPLFHKAAKIKKSKDREVEESAPGEGYEPSVGDEVRVDGKDGVVKVARGPHDSDTVGVMIDGELTMVKKKDIRLAEGVLGMTAMPDLARMRALAGIAAPEAESSDIAIQALPAPAEEPIEMECDATCAETPLSQIEAAFDTIEAALPDLKIRDAKDVRQRITQLMTKLNESAKQGRRV